MLQVPCLKRTVTTTMFQMNATFVTGMTKANAVWCARAIATVITVSSIQTATTTVFLTTYGVVNLTRTVNPTVIGTSVTLAV